MSEENPKSAVLQRAAALVAVIALALSGLAWSGCGGGDDTTPSGLEERIESGVTEAEEGIEEGVEEAEKELKSSGAKKRFENAKKEAEKGIEKGKEEAEKGVEEVEDLRNKNGD